MATEAPREKLKELIEKNGDSLIQDRDRCEGLLKDYCGGYRREISAIVGAIEERVPLELKSSWQTAMTPEAMRARLVQRLEDNRGLAPEIANYAVDTWSYALGVGLGRSSERVHGVPVSHVNGSVGGGLAAEQAVAAAPAVPPVVVKTGMSNQNKAVVGGVGLLAVATIAFALLHHPAPATPSGGISQAPHGQTPQNPPPAAPVVQNPQPAQANPPSASGGQNLQPQGNAEGSQPTKLPSIALGALVTVRLDSDFTSDNSTVGELLPATVVTPLTSEGNVVVQPGSKAQLKVVKLDKSGKISGQSYVKFALVRLTAHGKLIRISGSSKDFDGPPQGVKTAERKGDWRGHGPPVSSCRHRRGSGSKWSYGRGY
jgi:hypothetical protein